LTAHGFCAEFLKFKGDAGQIRGVQQVRWELWNNCLDRVQTMYEQGLERLLAAVRDGAVSIAEAKATLVGGPVADLGYAQVDLERQYRCGHPEVIFCEGKEAEWVVEVARRLHDAGQDCLATRVSDAQSQALAQVFPDGDQDRVARTFWRAGEGTPPKAGSVLVITAGTSDLSVAREALVTARALGASVELLADVGVAGIHRLLRHHADFSRADAIVVVAGMDGALPSVVGGLVDCPVIAVPTSVGYGAAFGGLAPLLTMLNSCASNVVVVNINAGFKAGYAAALISRRRCDHSHTDAKG
jgi:NCAIR mutase (PurE)-related protein